MPLSDPPLIVVMGVSGCGKSSVGACIAARLQLPFLEGDQLHSEGNVNKMAAGIPLQDDDRWPWLDSIGARLTAAASQSVGLIVACSALRKAYRDRLRAAAHGRLVFVFLHGESELLRRRLESRTGHFMPPSLLHSQLASVEDPRGEEGVLDVEISGSVDEIVHAACKGLGLAAHP